MKQFELTELVIDYLVSWGITFCKNIFRNCAKMGRIWETHLVLIFQFYIICNKPRILIRMIRFYWIVLLCYWLNKMDHAKYWLPNLTHMEMPFCRSTSERKGVKKAMHKYLTQIKANKIISDVKSVSPLTQLSWHLVKKGSHTFRFMFPECLSIGRWHNLWGRRRFADSSHLKSGPDPRSDSASPSNHIMSRNYPSLLQEHGRRHHAFNYIEDSPREIIAIMKKGD
jgi:uncharacterized protein (DUF486 family)